MKTFFKIWGLAFIFFMLGGCYFAFFTKHGIPPEYAAFGEACGTFSGVILWYVLVPREIYRFFKRRFTASAVVPQPLDWEEDMTG